MSEGKYKFNRPADSAGKGGRKAAANRAAGIRPYAMHTDEPYNDEQWAFIKACADFKLSAGRELRPADILSIAHALGYRRG